MLVTDADIRVILKPHSEWRTGLSQKRLEDDLYSLIRNECSDIRVNLSQPIEFLVSEVSGSRAPIEVLLSADCSYDELLKHGVLFAKSLDSLNEDKSSGIKNVMIPSVITEEHQILIPNSKKLIQYGVCLLYTSPSPRDQRGSRMPSSA